MKRSLNKLDEHIVLCLSHNKKQRRNHFKMKRSLSKLDWTNVRQCCHLTTTKSKEETF